VHGLNSGLEAAPVEIRDGDILIIHTGWQRYWEGQKQQDLVRYFGSQEEKSGIQPGAPQV
jgi:kynurenine formamidase